VNKEELGVELKNMYERGRARGESVVMIQLFGIRFAPQIRSGGFTPADIIAASGIQDSYATELSKGIKLAKHVDEKPAGTFSRAQRGVELLKDAVLAYIGANPTGVRNADIANGLRLRSDFQGGSKNYLSYSLLGLLLAEGKVKQNDDRSFVITNLRDGPEPPKRDNDVPGISPTCWALAEKLRRVWDYGQTHRCSKAMLVVFGAEFCSQIGQGRQCAVNSVVKAARLRVPSHANAVRLGMSIAPFVRIRDQPLSELPAIKSVPSIIKLGDELRRMREDPRYKNQQTATIFNFGIHRASEMRAFYDRENEVTRAAGITADHTANLRLAQQVSLYLKAIEPPA
jgi:hypothetical protein